MRLALKPRADYKDIDLVVAHIANLINIVMATSFTAMVFGLPQVEFALGIAVMVMGFALGYIAFLNK